MHELIEYRKLTTISLLPQTTDKSSLCFQVKLEQHHPHRIFKYEIIRPKQDLVNLYNRLEQQIFDFQNPFSKNIIGNFTKAAKDEIDAIDQSLILCTNRLDVLTNKQFVGFFGLQVHYPDFIECLDQQKIQNRTPQYLKNTQKQKDSKPGEQYCTDRPWKKGEIHKQLPLSHSQVNGDKIINRTSHTKQSSFQGMINLLYHQSSHKLQTQEGSILDLIHLSLYGNNLIVLLEECKQTTKVKNLIKTFFNRNNVCGYISIHKRQGDKYLKRYVTPLHTQPISMQYDSKINMLMVMTTVGIYIYLAERDKFFQEIQLFGYVELPGVCDFCVNPTIGEIYLLRREPTQELHSYNINKEKIMKTQFKYRNPASICLQQINSRLFVSDQDAIFVYAIEGSMEIKKLHFLTFNSSFQKLIQNHGYLLAISDEGSMTVIELKPPQKQKLISVVTRIELPAQTNNLVGSFRSQRLMICNYRDCVVLLDTMEGPIYSYQQGRGEIKKLVGDRQAKKVLSVTEDGWISVFKINDKIT